MVFFLCALKDALWGWGFRPNLPAALQEQITPSECGMGIYRLWGFFGLLRFSSGWQGFAFAFASYFSSNSRRVCGHVIPPSGRCLIFVNIVKNNFLERFRTVPWSFFQANAAAFAFCRVGRVGRWLGDHRKKHWREWQEQLLSSAALSIFICFCQVLFFKRSVLYCCMRHGFWKKSKL